MRSRSALPLPRYVRRKSLKSGWRYFFEPPTCARMAACPVEAEALGSDYQAAVLRAVTDAYLRRSGLDIKLDHGVDNMAMAMSLVASTGGLALMPLV